MSYVLGAADAFDALVYGPAHPGTVNFLRQHVTQLSNTLTESGREWMQRGVEIYQKINSSEAMMLARKATQSVKNLFSMNQVHCISEIEDFQSASVTMQRWIMSSPIVRNLYHAQKCDGYSSSYIDMHPGVSGDKHYDYRRVMDGTVLDSGDDGWRVKFYMDELHPDDRDLTHFEKTDIRKTWASVEALISMGEGDPTSDIGSNL